MTLDLDALEPPEFLLALLNRTIQEAMNTTLRHYGLKLVEWRLLECLAQQRSLTINDLAELAVIERTVTSRLVEKLGDRKLVRKTASMHDKRFAQVSLTPKGRTLLDSCKSDVDTVRNSLFSRFSTEDLTTLNQTLETLLDNAHAAKRLGRRRAAG